MESLVGRPVLMVPRLFRSLGSKPCVRARYFSVSVCRQALSGASVSLRAGVPSVTIRLPGAGASCIFACPPVTHKVGDLIRDIKAQDSSIDVVSIQSKSGDVIADSTTSGVLLREDFVVLLDGASFPVTIPDDVRNCVEHLDDVRALVSRLYSSLNIAENDNTHREALQSRLADVEAELQPLNEAYDVMTKKARSRNSVFVWGTLAYMSVQFGLLARLTWWEYSWDIMEPVTYFVTYGTAIACYAYFVLTREDYTYPAARDRNYLLNLHKSLSKADFPVDKYNELVSEGAKIRSALQRMQDPVKAPERMRSDQETSV